MRIVVQPQPPVPLFLGEVLFHNVLNISGRLVRHCLHE